MNEYFVKKPYPNFQPKATGYYTTEDGELYYHKGTEQWYYDEDMEDEAMEHLEYFFELSSPVKGLPEEIIKAGGNPSPMEVKDAPKCGSESPIERVHWLIHDASYAISQGDNETAHKKLAEADVLTHDLCSPPMEVKDAELYIWDGIYYELVKCKSHEDFEKYVRDNYVDKIEGVHPDVESIRLYQEVSHVEVKTIDGAKNEQFDEIVELSFPSHLKEGEQRKPLEFEEWIKLYGDTGFYRDSNNPKAYQGYLTAFKK